jgi:hypothetical protein
MPAPDVLDEIRTRAAADSPLWAAALVEGEALPAFAGRLPASHLLGVEMIREGYLMHHGLARLFTQDDADLSLLTGDYLYAAGLVEICSTGDLAAVETLAELIAACSRARGEGRPLAEDEALWDAALAKLSRPEASAVTHP